MRLYAQVFLVLNLVVIVPTFAATILKGDSGSTTTTFSFSVGPYEVYGGVDATSLMIGANQAVASNTFSVAWYSGAAAQFIPIGVSTASLNGVAGQANPLYAQKIKAISVQQDIYGTNIPTIVVDKETIDTPVAGSERFVVVSDVALPKVEQPTNVAVTLAQSAVPNDASGSAACDYIEQITSGYFLGDQPLIFGAVTAHGGGSAFGTGNSGVAVAKYIKPKDKPTNTSIQLCDAHNGTTGNRAALFNTTSSALKVGDDITFETTTRPVVDLHWDSVLQRLFVAVRVTAANGASNGARALVVGRVEGSKLIFVPFVPDAVVTGGSNNNLVAAKDGRSVSLYKVRTMHTSTGPSYVIVNGGNNIVDESGILKVANHVYALPLVDERSGLSSAWKTSATHATAADVTQHPSTYYNPDNGRFLSRYFGSAATTASQLFTTSDRAAVVGAGTVPLIIGTQVIKDMFVVGDAVFVSIAADYDEDGGQIQEPGVFSSRAIFDGYGAIVAWTPWQRVAGSDDRGYGARLEATMGNFWLITGSSDSAVNTVKKTLWSSGAKDGLLGGTTGDASVGLVSVLNNFFPEKYSGIFSSSTCDAYNNPAGIPHSGLTGKTAMLASGYQKVAFVITGDNSQATGTIKPYTGDFAAYTASSTNGSFPTDATARVFLMSGGSLTQLGPITTQTIFSNNTQSWIAVGGINGLVILSGASGEGFEPDSLPTGFTFKKVSGYANVQKVFGDGTYLYVLTSGTLERLVPSTLERTVIATSMSIGIGKNGTFSDALVADKMALIATSYGLFRIANGCSVKTGIPAWKQIALGESLGPVFSLSYVACATDYNTGLATAGQVFALGSYQGLHEARLYRLYINEGTTISDTSVHVVNDNFIEDVSSYFASFGQFRSAYTDDGATRLAVSPSSAPHALALYALPYFMRTGLTGFPTKYSRAVIAGLVQGGLMGTPLRLSSSGAWMVNGSFGLQVNE